MTARTRRASELSVGQPVPGAERTLALSDLVAYGAATWDWHRLHYDTAYTAARNLPGPVVDGQMWGAILAQALVDWLGPGAFIRRLSFRMKGMVFAGEAIRVEGEVAQVAHDGERGVVTVALRIRAGDRLAVDPASAEVLLPP